ncbi:MAG: hypothetical protein HYZ14_13945 [Bacteroidetes bacterium]|nr:hypothetical protein [Bacteroidota bacterium]
MENRPANLIQHATVAPDSVIELLAGTLIGTEGSLYQLMDTREKIHRLDQPHFFYIERNNKALGTITICERNVMLTGNFKQALYIRYFAFDSAFQGSGTKTRERNSMFDQHWKKIFETGNLNNSESDLKSTFFWAYIDPQNLRSFRMNERFGFESVGTFETIAYSRFNPKKSANVMRLKPDEQEEVLNLISNFYKDYAFFSDAHLFEDNRFFVLRQDGKIVAGVQANPARFKIVSLPGLGGKIALKLFPVLPFMKKIINPKEHKFLATEGIFWLPGYEHKMDELLSGVLAELNHHSLLIWEDKSVSRIKSLPLKWGLLQKIKKNNAVNIVVKTVNLPRHEEKMLKETPKYLSGFDMT